MTKGKDYSKDSHDTEAVLAHYRIDKLGVSNRRTGIWNGTMEWKMEWNSECTQLRVTCVTGTAQSRLNYLMYLQACYLTAEAL